MNDGTLPLEDRVLYLEQLRQTIQETLRPELSSAQAREAAILCERILGGMIAEERSGHVLSERFGEALRDLVRPGDPTGPGAVGPEEFAQLRAEAAEMVRRLEASPEPGAHSQALDLVELERALFEEADRIREAVLNEMPGGAGSTTERCSLTEGQLTAFFRSRLVSSSDVVVEHLEVLPGGRSKETILVSLSATTELPDQVVLRMDRPVGLLPTRAVDEFAILRAVFDFGGVPVPEPYFAGEGELGPGSFLVMERVAGVRAGEFFPELGAPSEQREELGVQIASALARLHSIPLDRLGATRLGEPPGLSESSIRSMVDSIVARIAELSGPPCATVEIAGEWLRQHASDVAPAPRMSLLQADFGFHNMLVDGRRLTALVDWEGASIGPPAREMAAAWPVATHLMTWRDFVGAYLAHGGDEGDVDAQAISFYRVFMALGGLMTSRTGGHLFRTGAKRDLLTANSGFDSQFRCMRNLARALRDADVGAP